MNTTNLFIVPEYIRNILLSCTDVKGNLATGKILKYKNDEKFQNWLIDNLTIYDAGYAKIG